MGGPEILSIPISDYIFNKKESYPQHMNDPDYAHIDVVNYLDMNAEVIDGQLQPFNIKELYNKFPDIDEFTLYKWKNEWVTARQRLLNMKF